MLGANAWAHFNGNNFFHNKCMAVADSNKRFFVWKFRNFKNKSQIGSSQKSWM